MQSLVCKAGCIVHYTYFASEGTLMSLQRKKLHSAKKNKTHHTQHEKKSGLSPGFVSGYHRGSLDTTPVRVYWTPSKQQPDKKNIPRDEDRSSAKLRDGTKNRTTIVEGQIPSIWAVHDRGQNAALAPTPRDVPALTLLELRVESRSHLLPPVLELHLLHMRLKLRQQRVMCQLQ